MKRILLTVRYAFLVCGFVLITVVAAVLFKVGSGYISLNERPNEIWIADEVGFYMKWDEDAKTILGKVKADGRDIDVEIGWELGNGVAVFPYPLPEIFTSDSRLMSGFVEEILKNKYYILYVYGERYPRKELIPGNSIIRIVPYDISEVEWVDGWPVPIEG